MRASVCFKRSRIYLMLTHTASLGVFLNHCWGLAWSVGSWGQATVRITGELSVASLLLTLLPPVNLGSHVINVLTPDHVLLSNSLSLDPLTNFQVTDCWLDAARSFHLRSFPSSRLQLCPAHFCTGIGDSPVACCFSHVQPPTCLLVLFNCGKIDTTSNLPF